MLVKMGFESLASNSRNPAPRTAAETAALGSQSTGLVLARSLEFQALARVLKFWFTDLKVELRPANLRRNLSGEQQNLVIWLAGLVGAMNKDSDYALNAFPVREAVREVVGPFAWSPPGQGFPETEDGDCEAFVFALMSALDYCLPPFLALHQLEEIAHFVCECGNTWTVQTPIGFLLCQATNMRQHLPYPTLEFFVDALRSRAAEMTSCFCPACGKRGRLDSPILFSSPPDVIIINVSLYMDEIGRQVKKALVLDLDTPLVDLTAFFESPPSGCLYALEAVLQHKSADGVASTGHYLVLEAEGVVDGGERSFCRISDEKIRRAAITSSSVARYPILLKLRRVLGPTDLTQSRVVDSLGNTLGPPALTSTPLPALTGARQRRGQSLLAGARGSRSSGSVVASTSSGLFGASTSSGLMGATPSSSVLGATFNMASAASGGHSTILYPIIL